MTQSRELVVYQPAGRRVRLDPEKSLLELATMAGVGIEASCGGKGTCGACRVKVDGEATDPDQSEAERLGTFAGEGFRLACRARPRRGLTVWVPEESRRHQQVILATGDRIEVPVDSAVLARGLGADSDGPLLGLAVDLGTTTVVAYLHDLNSGAALAVETAMNPQVVHGDDLISRLAFGSSDRHGRETLTRLARQCVNSLARRACRAAGVGPERIFHCVLVGNTAMHHIFLGLDLAGLTRAPFQPTACDARELPAAALGLEMAPDAFVTTLPLKAGFVGADAVAVALALGADGVTEPTLIADLGTNGELILATPGAIVCCSTAAGPAFEGGHITWGMRAAPGAVDGVELPSVDLPPRLSVIGGRAPLGICGSGLVAAVHALLRRGVLGPQGRFAEDVPGPWLRRGPEGPEFVLADAAHSGTGRDLVLTRRDVSELQLAKGAVHAGVALMMAELGLDAIGRVLLAGAFGNYLDPVHACGIGLFPGVTPERVRGVGNAAGAGAILGLLNRGHAERAGKIAKDMRYLELAGDPRFGPAYAKGLHFPSGAEASAP
ncbi:MAG TPA: ASKHA domain-containing protein [Deferrisomatales bacterium]|nr:ASKHA domain-containing protein [Deferrisomatales bacterium]